MKIELELYNLKQISVSISAVQNAIEGKAPRAVDYVPLIYLKSILEEIKRKTRATPPEQECPEEKTLDEIIGILRAYCGEKGNNEGAVDTLLRLEDELLAYRRGKPQEGSDVREKMVKAINEVLAKYASGLFTKASGGELEKNIASAILSILPKMATDIDKQDKK